MAQNSRHLSRRGQLQRKFSNVSDQDKPYRLYDEQGLYLEVQPNGGRYWRLNYRFLGKEKRLALGVYPEVGLHEARRKCDDARGQLAGGQDPSLQRRMTMSRSWASAPLR